MVTRINDGGASKKVESGLKVMEFGGLRVALLETFVLLASVGKRTAVASELGLRQGTVTKQIQDLERWAQTILVEHNSSPAKLTPHGEEFLVKAKRLLAVLEDARKFTTSLNE